MNIYSHTFINIYKCDSENIDGKFLVEMRAQVVDEERRKKWGITHSVNCFLKTATSSSDFSSLSIVVISTRCSVRCSLVFNVPQTLVQALATGGNLNHPPTKKRFHKRL